MKNTRWTLITNHPRNGEDPGSDCILSADAFHALLRRERSRSDRENNTFGLAVFDLSGPGVDAHRIQHFVRNVKEKMRCIDEIGWLDFGKVGMLLPITGLEGASMFRRRLLETSPESASLIPCTLYSYPDSWLPCGQEKSRADAADRTEYGRSSAGAMRGAFSLRIPVWKRCMDILGSAVLILLLSPVFLLMCIYLKIASPGKVLFRQERVGYGMKTFTLFKFRTMRECSDPADHRRYLRELIKGGTAMEKLDSRKDSRIIRGGRVIRKACLDELPQLFNVLRGEMSLVGPRPCIPYEAEEYLRWHTRRFDILPGMTGLWQVSGKNKLSFEQMIRLDISYSNRITPLRDMKILLLTLPAIAEMILEASLRTVTGQHPAHDRKAWLQS